MNLHYFYYLYYFFLVLLFCRRRFYCLFLQLCQLHFFQLPQMTSFSSLSVRCLPHQWPMGKDISSINRYDEKWNLNRVTRVGKWERISILIHTGYGNYWRERKTDAWNPYQLVNGIKGNFMALQTKFDCLFLTSKRRASFPIYIRSLHFEIMLYVDQGDPCELVKTKNYLIEAFFP